LKGFEKKVPWPIVRAACSKRASICRALVHDPKIHADGRAVRARLDAIDPRAE